MPKCHKLSIFEHDKYRQVPSQLEQWLSKRVAVQIGIPMVLYIEQGEPFRQSLDAGHLAPKSPKSANHTEGN